MAYSNGIISAPVSIYDVQRALGNGSSDLGTLCMDPNINMWAKYKPVVRANLIDTTGQLKADKTWKTSSEIEGGSQLSNNAWWKGDDTNHGLTVPYATSSLDAEDFVDALDTIAAMIDGSKNGWGYTRPSGGMASPYRILDFNQYNHNAPNPIRTSGSADTFYSSSDHPWDYSFNMMEVEPIAYDSRDYIVPTDLRISGATLETLYPGLAIFKRTNNTYNAIAWGLGNAWTAVGILGPSAQDGVLFYDNVAVAKFKDNGVYYGLPVYFTHNDVAQPQSGQSVVNSSGCKIIPVPYTNFMQFTCVQRATTQNVGFPDLSNHTVTQLYRYSTDVYLDSTVSGYTGGTASSVRVAVVNELWNDVTDIAVQGSYAYDNTWNNVVVGSSERKLVGSISSIALGRSHTWRVLIWVNGEKYTYGLIVPAPITPA